ncbi:MAG: hypothetical protein LBV46_02090 [Bacteroidales bacterium]|jgi:lipopolysaccharide export system protein LptA|nr:hypothetical protein [Bacteroidales bacterium]
MYKKGVILIIISMMCTGFLYAQHKKIICKADSLMYDEAFMPGVERLLGSVVFYHENTIGYCDSAYNYSALNQIECFGKVVRIHVNDSVTLYGKHVLYDANLKMATIDGNVILMDPTTSLYTDTLHYDLNKDVGYYLTGGKILNGENTVTSREGHYFSKKDEFILKGKVHLVNYDYVMDCESLTYNTKNKIVYFTSRTLLVAKEDSSTIETSGGWYNTDQDVSFLVGDVEMHKTAQKVLGDTIFYDKNLGFAILRSNVSVVDTAKNYILQGHYVEYFEKGGMSMATRNAMLTLIDDTQDSLFLHGDTLNILIDSVQDPQLMLAYNHVKFFRADMQGACDSLSYQMTDSLLTMFYNPVVWSGENQLSADTIRFYMLPEDNMRAEFIKSGFIVASLYDDTEFNQIKGVNITGFIRNKQLYQVDVENNAECLYYIQEEDSSLVGINYSLTSEMTIMLEDNKVSHITFYNNPDGKIYPDSAMSREDRILKEFRWLKEYRPEKIEDIFVMPMPRKKTIEGN